MIVNNILQNQSGVQYSQSTPQTDEETIEKLDKLLFVGEFKRGPFHKPFKVTAKTMDSILGKDFKNPCYIALQDAFEIGAEEIWVMRLENSEIDFTTPPFTAWIISSNITVQNGTARYTAYKENIADHYDSFAEIDLTQSIVRSFHDADMQQWQAVNDAAFAADPAVLSYSIDAEKSVFNIRRQATDVTTDDIINVIVSRYNTSPLNFVGKGLFQDLMVLSDWIIDEAGKVKKTDQSDINANPSQQFCWSGSAGQGCYSTPEFAAQFTSCSGTKATIYYNSETIAYANCENGAKATVIRKDNPNYDSKFPPPVVEVAEAELAEKLRAAIENPQTNADLINSAFEYDPIAGANDLYQKTVLTKSFTDIAQQIILNTQSSNQAIFLLAEAYLENVAKSILSADASKQFVKPEELDPIFEQNKILKK